MTVEEDKPKTVEEAQLGIDKDQEFHQQCLLFPSYATKHASDGTLTDEWHLRVRGWAFEAPKGSTTRTMFLSVTSMVTGVHQNDEAYDLLVKRTDFFWKRNVKRGEFMVQTIGLTDSNKFAVEGDPNEDDASQPSQKSEEDHGIAARVKNFAQVNLSKHAPDDIRTAKIVAEAGHFLGSIAVPMTIVKKWGGETNEHDNTSWFRTLIGAKSTTTTGGPRLLKIQAFQTSTAEPAYGVVNLNEPEGYSVISDIDDTIKDTDILAGVKRIFSNTFLHNFKEVPGMPDLYRDWYEKGVGFHYVSNSPWQLFPSLREFFRTYQFPPGSAHFKFYDGLIKSAREQRSNPMASKFMYINEIFADFPMRKFILVGDSGELDPEIYTTVAKENPGRVLRIFIRDVTTKYVKDLPPQQSRYSYLRTFPSMIRNLYKGDDDEAAQTAETVVHSGATNELEEEQTSTQEDKGDVARKEDKGDVARKEDKGDVATKEDKGDVATKEDKGDVATKEDKGDVARSTENERSRTMAFLEKLSMDVHFLRKSATREIRAGVKDEGASNVEEAAGDEDGGTGLPPTPSASKEDKLRTPLEMFTERIEKLRDEIEASGQPRDLLVLFTDAQQLMNDEIVNAKLAESRRATSY